MSLLSDTLAKVGSTAIAREKTFTTTPTTNRQQRRAATVDKAIKRYNAAPEQIVVQNPIQEALEIPFTDIGMPFRETLFPDMVVTKAPLGSGQWYNKDLSFEGEYELGARDVQILPRPIIEDVVETGAGFTPQEDKEIREAIPDVAGDIQLPELPNIELPDIFGALGEFGKYALLGLGALAVIMLMKK